VPNELSDVAVVEGKPAVSARPCSEDRKGAASGLRRSSSQPMPSTSSTTVRAASSSASGFGAPATPSEASTDGRTSASDASP
jgi:hypothetical protein